MTRYRWVDSRRAEGFAVTLACAVAGVSTSAFYAWWQRMRHGPNARELEEAYLVNAILDCHRDSDGAYGRRASPRSCDETAGRSTASASHG